MSRKELIEKYEHILVTIDRLIEDNNYLTKMTIGCGNPQPYIAEGGILSTKKKCYQTLLSELKQIEE